MSKEVDGGQDKQVEMWKVKKLIKSLQAARGLVHVFFFFKIKVSFEKLSKHSIILKGMGQV